MFAPVIDLNKLTALSRSKAYRDSYLTGHVRAGIAYQIQALREGLGLSQIEFARMIGMTQSVVSRLENPDYGKVTVQTLLQVALALDMALLVRFCSYPDFLAAIADVSPEALAVENIHETMKHPYVLPKLMTSLSYTSTFNTIALNPPPPVPTPQATDMKVTGTLTALAV